MHSHRRSLATFFIALVFAGCGGGGSVPPATAVYLDSTEVILRESYPVQAALILRGNLATPCHTLHTQVAEPDERGRILVTVWAEADPDEVCIQVLESFEETVELGSYTSGTFSVWVNGEPVGEIDLG
jgi:hypothetical protein